MGRALRITLILLLSVVAQQNFAQTCNNWLRTTNGSVTIGDLDVPGNYITVEAVFNRTAPWVGNYLFAGDIVSKHDIPSNVNYLLRPNNAEITTSNGYFATPFVCNIELNKTYHAALVYDGNTLKFYRNGVLLSQRPASGTLVTNDWITTIGNYAYNNPIGTNFQGYINEVRIWNVARTQSQLRDYMFVPISNPASELGLLAYYTFDNLINKQGNAMWNGTLNTNATLNNTNPNCTLIADSCSTPVSIPIIINNYAPVRDLNLCNNNIVVQDAMAFKTGDTVILMQMQGVEMDTANVASFGNLTSIQNAGNYEYNYIKSISGNVIELKNALIKNYDFINGKVQLIRVPYFDNLNVTTEITCLPWDGEKGGVIAFEVRNNLTLNANINASGKGFRGGMGFNILSDAFYCNIVDFRFHDTSTLAAFKGESVAMLRNTYSKGRGAPTNGGGGGQDHNSGGGGGANGGTGGLGGYQWSDCPISVDNRGMGGKPLPYNNTFNKVYLGGGGGAGHCNNIGFNSSGGNGGGIIIIKAGSITANGRVIASNGQNGNECIANGMFSYCHEGMGGGGAGGVILLDINNYINPINVESKGGQGGNMTGENLGSLGPGGGGGGGVVWLKGNSMSSQITSIVDGGRYGINTQINTNEYGATSGTSGLNLLNLTLPISTTDFVTNIDTIVATPTQTSCRNFQFTSQGITNTSPIINWNWNFGDGLTNNTTTPNHTYTNDGNYIIKLFGSDINGCIDSTEISVTVLSATINAGSDQQFCSSTSVTASLNATGNGNISWSPQSLFTNPNLPNQTITLSNSVTIYATSTLNANCDAIDSIRININPNTVTDVTQDLCVGAFPFSWNGQNIQTPGLYTTTLTSSSNCDSTINLTINLTDTIRNNISNSMCNDLLPYSWNGQSISAPGIYTSHHLNSFGCDSLNILNLEIIAATSSLRNEEICENLTPFNWNGLSITSSGRYESFFTNAAGCDSAAVLEIVIKPIRRSNTNLDICFSQTPYSWNGQTLNNSGSYTANLNGMNGCDSIATLILNVTPVLRSTTSLNICSNLLPYSWNGQNLSSTGIYNFNLVSTSGCDSIATLNLNIGDPQSTFTTLSICSSQLPYNWNSQSINQPGTYTTTLRSVADCDSIVTLDLSVRNVISNTISQEICESDFPYVWNSLNITQIGTYNSTLVSQYGCDSVVTLNLTARPSIPLNASADTTICSMSSLQLIANTGFSNYQWTPAAYFNNSNTRSPIYLGSNSNQSLYISAIGSNGCTSRDTVLITMLPSPQISVTNDTTICKDIPITLYATGALNYSWTPSNLLLNPLTSTPTYNGSASNNFIVTGTDANGCSANDTVQISLRQSSNLVAPPNKSTCFGNPVELDGFNGSNYSYAWNFTPTLSAYNISNPIATPTSTSTYSVLITDNDCGYDSTFNVIVTVHQLPNIIATKSGDIHCSTNTIRLNATGGTSYSWNNSPSLSNVNIRNPIATPQNTTQYIVTGTDGNGCSNSDSITVIVTNNLGSYLIPNAFTPNGDGLNDCFGIAHWGVTRDLTFTIYNRWGELVFETNNVNVCWDGTYKGKPAEKGNYVYYVSGNTSCGKLLKRGNVVLIR